MEWRPAGWSVCLFPCTIKSRSSLLALAHPGGPGKRVVKWLRWWWWFSHMGSCLGLSHFVQQVCQQLQLKLETLRLRISHSKVYPSAIHFTRLQRMQLSILNWRPNAPCFNGHFAGEHGVASYSLILFLCLFWKRTSMDNWHGFFNSQIAKQ